MESKIVLQLRSLAHASRLAAYRALVQAGPAGLAVGALRDLLDIPPATLTAHLNVLRSAALVTDEREGRVIRVRADFERMGSIEKGKLADFFLVPGDPTRDLKAVKTIAMVVKDGTFYYPSEVYPKFGIEPFTTAPKVTLPRGE